MFNVMNYADRNDVEVSIRKGHDGRTEWEIFLRDHKLGMTEFTRIIDIEIRGRHGSDPIRKNEKRILCYRNEGYREYKYRK